MLEINKASFYSERWRREPLRTQYDSSNKSQHKETPTVSELNEEMGLGLDYNLIADGRMLFNYYDFDYNGILYAVNSIMMGMLIRMQFEGGYHIYVFR